MKLKYLMALFLVILFISGCSGEISIVGSIIFCSFCEQGQLSLASLSQNTDTTVVAKSLSTDQIKYNSAQFRRECDMIPIKSYKRIELTKEGTNFVIWVDATGETVCMVKNPDQMSFKTTGADSINIQSQSENFEFSNVIFCILCWLFQNIDELGLTPFQQTLVQDSSTDISSQLIEQSVTKASLSRIASAQAISPNNAYYRIKFSKGEQDIIMWVDPVTYDTYIDK